NSEDDNCLPGFRRNRWSRECEDINECETEYMPCRREQSCRNTVGSYVCYCQAGYIKDGVTGECKDVNECQLGTHTCHHTLRCDNTIGSFHCVRVQDCGTGYTINAETDLCEDINECEVGIDNCGQDFRCRNIDGSFKCDRVTCPYGQHLTMDGNCRPNECEGGKMFNNTYNRCVDINECLNQPCAANQKCINTVGSYRCTHYCTPGYQPTKYGNACEDIDECVEGTHECTGMQICRNRPGNYICECPLGYILNQNRDCEDINECTRYGSTVCSPDTSSCVNTIGSYRCQCKHGFEEDGSGRFCTDIDECKSGHRCSDRCFNTWGSYQCSCESGFKISTDNRTCVDVDECDEFEKKDVSKEYYLCVGKCHNTPGSFRCSCPVGYRLGTDERTCQDINECEESNQCRGDDQICLNTRGSFKCNRIECPNGYERDTTHKSRCKKTHGTAVCTDQTCISEDLRDPMAYTYNYLTFTSNMTIPSTGYLDLFTMRGPVLSVTTVQFELNLNSATIGKYGVPPATKDFFQMRRTAYNEAMVSLTKPIVGPQDIELDLEVKLYHGGTYGGSAKAILYIYNLLTIVAFEKNRQIGSSSAINVLQINVGPEIQQQSYGLNYGVPPATKDFFQMRRTAYNEAMVSLTKPIVGPQDIELDLEVKLYHGGTYGGSAKAILYIYVTEYSF
ncbi:unnamed protein product, partial [Medioppia subpectinata]